MRRINKRSNPNRNKRNMQDNPNRNDNFNTEFGEADAEKYEIRYTNYYRDEENPPI